MLRQITQAEPSRLQESPSSSLLADHDVLGRRRSWWHKGLVVHHADLRTGRPSGGSGGGVDRVLQSRPDPSVKDR
jgi:hypothetical protein